MAQIEEIGFDQFRRRKTELTDALDTFQKANSYFFSTVLITDITHQNSLLLVSGPQHLLDAIAYQRLNPGSLTCTALFLGRNNFAIPHGLPFAGPLLRQRACLSRMSFAESYSEPCYPVGQTWPSSRKEGSRAGLENGKPVLGALCLYPFACRRIVSRTYLQKSRQLTIQRFGRTIRMFAPLYVSNECINNCTYCGFSRDNLS